MTKGPANFAKGAWQDGKATLPYEESRCIAKLAKKPESWYFYILPGSPDTMQSSATCYEQIAISLVLLLHSVVQTTGLQSIILYDSMPHLTEFAAIAGHWLTLIKSLQS